MKPYSFTNASALSRWFGKGRQAHARGRKPAPKRAQLNIPTTIITFVDLEVAGMFFILSLKKDNH